MNKDIDYTQFRKNPFLFLRFISQKYFWIMSLVIVMIVASEIIFAGVMIYLGKLTDAINVSQNYDNLGDIYHWVIWLSASFAVSFLLWRITGFIGSYVSTKIEAYSIEISFKYLIKHSYSYFADRLVGKLSSKVINIAQSIDTIIPMMFWDFSRIITKFIIFCVIAFRANFWMGVIFAVAILSFLFFNIFAVKKLAIYSKKRADKASELRGNIVDDLANVMAVHQNVKIEVETKNINKYVDIYRKAHLKSWRFFEAMLSINSFMAVILLIIILFSSIKLWEMQLITLGIVVMIILMTTRLVGDLVFVGATFNRFIDQFGQLKEGLEEIFEPYEIIDKKNAKTVNLTKGRIVFNNVGFRYNKQDSKQIIFKDISLTIPSGQKIGLVGKSGAGKSTFVSLLLRFMDIDTGSITIDDYDIKQIKQDDLREAIAYVPQEALLFHRTIEHNISYSNLQASDTDIQKAAQRAHATEFINRFPQGFKTFVGERGVKLSGGQRQRIMIARAMLKNSPILVLDEATSSLDSYAEKFIQEALEELMKNRTTIVIAHRLSTLKKMDRIIVFDEGEIIEDGTHKELIDLKGKYWELWQHQIGAFG